jgi:D-beta-D-heptose 7-phosphate kinase/D-beta-D-heptose 1-phosphate adenosyltransferase
MITVIGDYIEDVYVYGEVKRISPESPIPIFKEYTREIRHGGSGNVVENIRSFGEEVNHYCSFNSIKTRYVCNNHILFRTDKEQYIPNTQTEFKIESEYVILSDYNKGYLDKSQDILFSCLYQGAKVIVDPKKSLDNYKNATIIKLNEEEFNQYGFGKPPYEIRKKLNIDSIIITKGRDGVYISSDEFEGHIETDIHQVSDVTGAGDVFIASMTYYLSKKNSLYDACKKAVNLASISVTKFGTYVLTEKDIAQNKLVFTNGCFDILHKGHIDYLQKSKKLGNKLIVGLNSDASIKRLKGDTRPINNQEDRKAVLESLGCVDKVIIFDEDTPYDLIKQIKPDIITKGGDYKLIEDVVGHDLAEVKLIPYVEGYSTTKILESIK